MSASGEDGGTSAENGSNDWLARVEEALAWAGMDPHQTLEEYARKIGKSGPAELTRGEVERFLAQVIRTRGGGR